MTSGAGGVVWQPDSEAPRCGDCQVKFGMRVRKHHCRACGKIFCAKCSGNKIALPNLGMRDPQRVCIACWRKRLAEDEERHKREEQRRQQDEEKRERQRQHDEDYVSSIYDTDGLIVEILRYLQGGCELSIVSPSGERERCRFWLHRNGPSLCWTDPQTVARGARENKSIPAERRLLSSVTEVLLGATTKTMKRAAAGQDYYLAFSILMQKDGTPERVDCVAEQLVDFEAWVLGLAHLLKIDPQWGEPLKVEKDKKHKELTPEEKAVAAKHHIQPALMQDAKEIMRERAAEVAHQRWLFDGDMEAVWKAVGGPVQPVLDHNGALLVTKGELRFETGLDIFRATALWTTLRDLHIIFDPYFRPATGKGSDDPDMKPYKRLELPVPGDQERRVDPADGHAYTKQEFFDEYGGTKEWDEAQPVRPRAQTVAGDVRRGSGQGRRGSVADRRSSGQHSRRASVAAHADAKPDDPKQEEAEGEGTPEDAGKKEAGGQVDAGKGKSSEEEEEVNKKEVDQGNTKQEEEKPVSGTDAQGCDDVAGEQAAAAATAEEGQRKVSKKLSRLLVATATVVLTTAAWQEARAARKRERKRQKELQEQEGAGDGSVEAAVPSNDAEPSNAAAEASNAEPKWSEEGKAAVEALLRESGKRRKRKKKKNNHAR
eukprot:TRINITY_DN17567_c0_g2_i5.p1 TRINITY_DN17567_c0_g2~~TRINITY_DN17567_c0_g2_i5.p1  ORF type:complete len:657 (+),score=186.09 TRINITY_DN17567_c0_g2_i5:96-2066(+)